MRFKVSRRRFGQLAMASASVASALETPQKSFGRSIDPARKDTFHAPDCVAIKLRVNGSDHSLSIEPRVTLLDALREYLSLTGSKKGCDHGQCGACTVLINGKRVNSCLTLAVMHGGDEITTIEGLANGEQLHPIQEAFIEHDGFQCGFCTPGQIMSAVALLKEHCGPSDHEVRECMSGNICRCGAYPNIVAAIQSVRKGGEA